MSQVIKYVKGDLVRDAERDFDVIAHGCNCYCTFGAGIALGVKNKWPEAYAADKASSFADKTKLGTYTQWASDDITVVNMYTQWDYKGTSVRADYDAIRSGMKALKNEFSGQKIGLPFIGAGLAGGDWGIISQIIEEELEGEDVTVVVWENTRDQWQINYLPEANENTKIAIIDNWLEIEVGWGDRPDGASIHLTKEDYKNYVNAHNESLPDVRPREYSEPGGSPKVVKVSDSLYKEIEESNGGLRLWRSSLSELVQEGKIEYII